MALVRRATVVGQYVVTEVLRCVLFSFLVAWVLISTALGVKITIGSASLVESKLVSLALLPLRSLFYGAVGTYVVAGPVLVLGLLLACFSLAGQFTALSRRQVATLGALVAAPGGAALAVWGNELARLDYWPWMFAIVSGTLAAAAATFYLLVHGGRGPAAGVRRDGQTLVASDGGLAFAQVRAAQDSKSASRRGSR